MPKLFIRAVDGPTEIPTISGLFGDLERARKVALGQAEKRHDPAREVVMAIEDEQGNEVERVALAAKEVPILFIEDKAKGEKDEGDNQDPGGSPGGP